MLSGHTPKNSDEESKMRSELSLHESEQQFREMIDALPVAIYTTDAEGRLTHFNSAAVEFSGRLPELGTDRWCVSWKLYYSDGRPMRHDECPMAVAIKDGFALQGAEAIAERPDGKRIWFEAYPSPLYDDEGNIVGGVNMLVDATERKRMKYLLSEQSRLLELIALGHPLEECLSALCEAVLRLNPGVRAAIPLPNDEGTAFERAIAPNFHPSFAEGIHGAPISELAIGTCGQAVFHNMSVGSKDIANDERWSKEWRDLCVACGVRAGHSTPIQGINGQALASFLLCFDELRGPNEWESHLIEFGTHVASIALERDRSNRVLRESNERLASEMNDMERLHALSTNLLLLDDVEAALNEVMAASAELLGSDKASVQVYEEENDRLKMVGVIGFDQKFLDSFRYVDASGITTCAALLRRGGGQVLVEDLSAAPEFTTFYQAATPYNVQAALSTPLYGSDGQLLGVFTIGWDHAHRPTKNKLQLLDLYAQQGARQIERKRREEALRRFNETLEERVAQRTTALAQSEEQQRRMASKLMVAEQEERRRISQVLHDSLQQQLYGVQMKLSFARQEAIAGDADAALKNLTEAEEWIHESIELTRQLTVDLSPPVLKSEGLVDMLGWLVSQMQEMHELDVQLEAEHAYNIPDEDMRQLLFQVVRELLFNVVKHANSDRATVEIYSGDEQLIVRVTDDGCGFDVSQAMAQAAQEGGFGLFSVRERLGLVNGDMEIVSAPGKGTSVTLNVPLPLT